MNHAIRRLRARQDRLLAAAARELCGCEQNPAVLGQVFSGGALPTTAGKYYWVHPVTVLGAEVEAAAPSLTTDSSNAFLVYVVGSKAAVAGDYLVCRFEGNRWVAERFSHTGTTKIPVLGCPCLVPSTLNMSVANPGDNFHIFQSATIQWMTVPPAYAALQLGPMAFLSTSTYTDDLSTDPFQYQIFCSGGFFALTRVFAHSQFGSPFREAYRYRWLPGLYGSTCSPFLFPQGQVFQGGNLGTVVSLSG